MSENEHEVQQSTLEERVLKSIATGDVHMRPRWFFILRAFLGVLGIAIVAVVLLYVTSLTVFAMRQSGALVGPQFGLSGWYALFRAIPVVLILCALIFIVTLEILVRRYAFAYRRPLVYSVLGILVFTVLGTYSSGFIPLHRRVLLYVERNPVPLVLPLYHHYGRPVVRGVYPGRITTTTENGFWLFTRRGQTVNVVLTPRTLLPPNFDSLEPGDMVVVFGAASPTSVYAFGVRHIDDKE